MRILVLAFAAACLTASSMMAAEVDYVRDVKPILREHCYRCHGPDRQESELRLDTAARLLDGGNLGPAARPGSAEQTLLLAAVRGTSDEVSRMPPEDESEALPAKSIAVLQRWIEAGAKHPEDERPARPSLAGSNSNHWAFQPIARPTPPNASNAWVRNPIDAFILDRLREQGLQPSPPASREVLVRRLYFDLLGLPPDPDAVRQFLEDESPDAYERLVDRLLASPHYGERWGRHWLDLARYADSDGYTNDVARVMWRYRDWVIDAHNADQPFDQFVIDQLAGDLRPEATQEQHIATGFHRNTQRNREGGSDAEQYRVEAVVDRVSTTGVVFLGLSLGCARCHDHKFDPLSQREFYQLFAFLNNQDEPQINVTLDAPEAAELAKLRAVRAARERDLRELDKRIAPLQTAWERELAARESAWRVLPAASVTSQSGGHFQQLKDGSWLYDGKALQPGVFTVEGTVPQQRVTAIRLEVLTHDSLPGAGPGWASNGNFLLHEIRFLGAANDASLTPLAIAGASADHEQPKFPIADALDGDAETGWAINLAPGAAGDIHTSREAIFTLAEPLEGGAKWRIELDQKQTSYLLGRFRFSISDVDPAELRPVSAALRAALRTPVDSRSKPQLRLLAEEFRERRPERRALVGEIERWKRDEAKLVKVATTTTLVMKELPSPRETHIHIRGDFLRPGKRVKPGVPQVLPPLRVDPAQGRLDPANLPQASASASEGTRRTDRLDLAKWLVDDRQPLTPRVTVNRVWQRYFGRGIVQTENDFGLQGSPPTHPQLLDWLAADFVADGWSLKRLNRRIVTSATYRQASDERPELAAVDPDNRLLGRQQRLRLEAESIRDTALAASGLLTARLKGPSVFPPQPDGVMQMTRNPNRKWVASSGADRYRRGMYTFFWRSTPHPFLKLFNAPETNTTCTRRDRSNTPLQALTLLNDEAFVEAAHALAGRVLRESPSRELDHQLKFAWLLCFARQPDGEELAAIRELWQAERDAGGLQYAQTPEIHRRWLPRELDPATSSAWVATARALLNLDEFITRE